MSSLSSSRWLSDASAAGASCAMLVRDRSDHVLVLEH